MIYDDFCDRLMQQIISSVMCNNLLVPIQKIQSERSKHVVRCGKDIKFRSIYRDILFLTFAALGQPNIDIGTFSRTGILHYANNAVACSRLLSLKLWYSMV